MAIWVLPILGVIDVFTTFYIINLGYSMEEYEVGFLASYFARMGLLFYYVPLYLLILFTFSFVLWKIKNSLDPSSSTDRFLFGVLIFVLCFVYGRLSMAIVSNIMLPNYLQGRPFLPKGLTDVFVFIVSVFQIVWFIKDDFVGFYQVGELEEGELE